MVRGLDRFKVHFENYADRYVLIGGTACSIAMAEAGVDFRATKDLDIVICVEALDADFVKAFWNFIREGKYKNRQQSTGKRLFYRFYDPEDKAFPASLELFSRAPDVLSLRGDSHLTPIPVDAEASSLSAILLNDDYYRFIHAGKQETDGLPILLPEYLIPLKAKAWLDLTRRHAAGEPVDDKDIRKHRNDVFRLYQVISPDNAMAIPASIAGDMREFLDRMQNDASLNLESLGLRNINLDLVAGDLRMIYELEG